MLKTLVEIDRELIKCNLLYEKGMLTNEKYIKKLRYINECANYIKRYNKTYTTKAINRTKQKTKKKNN